MIKKKHVPDENNGAFSFLSTRHSSPSRGTRTAVYAQYRVRYTLVLAIGAFHKCHLYEQKDRIAYTVAVYFSSN